MRGKDLDKGKHEIPWEAREVVYSWDDGWTIEKVQTPADLTLEGELMAHCARDHAFWVHKGVEVFFSLRTEMSVPKSTIYCKPVEFFQKEQPEDAQIPNYAYGNGFTIDGLRAGYKSTNYEHYYRKILFTFEFEGRELYLNHMSGRYDGENGENRLERVKEWLVSLGADKDAVAAWQGGYGLAEDYGY